MNALTAFDFNAFQVRVVLIDNNPWFIAQDIAMVFEYAKTDKMLALVDEEDKKVVNPQKMDCSILEQSFNSNTFRIALINESGLYAVIFGSTKPEAKAFKRWVTSEVLPQIRKTGKFEVKPKQELNIYARRVQIASNWNIPKGYFCVFHEISLLANKIGQEYQVGEYDLIDGSVGKCWSKYRKGKEWALPTIKFPIEFGDKRDSAHVEVTGYSNHELIHFREWLEDIYRYENLPKYLSGKYSDMIKA